MAAAPARAAQQREYLGGAVRICLKFLLTTELTYRDCLLWQVWNAFSSPQEENLQCARGDARGWRGSGRGRSRAAEVRLEAYGWLLQMHRAGQLAGRGLQEVGNEYQRTHL